jgi:hypothetical protein
MPYLVENLIEGRGKPICVGKNEMVSKAFQLMIKDQYSQLPVVDEYHKPIGMITFETIVKAINSFGIGIEELRVSSAYVSAPTFSVEDQLFDILNGVMKENAVLIVDQEKLIGIVTSFDSTEYFRKRAEDLMYIEDIEGVIKEFIQAFYTKNDGEMDENGLADAIKSITSDEKETKKKIKSAVVRYLEMINSKVDNDIFEELFLDIYDPPETKPFGKLFLSQFIDLLLNKERWSFYEEYFEMEPSSVFNLLDDVREIRNSLAHFKGELSIEDQNKLKFCAEWITRCYYQLQENIDKKLGEESVQPTKNLNKPKTLPAEEKFGLGKGKYTPLAIWLQSQPGSVDRIKLTFEEVETILENDLPPSAFTHSVWWANDSVGHIQSILWLDAGWRVAGKNLTNREVTFARIKEREKAYIDFWGEVITKFKNIENVPFKNISPDGASWVNLVSLPLNAPQKSNINLSFSLKRRFRIELYIDTGDEDLNKKLFDELHIDNGKIEKELGEKLSWERLDHRRASRVALYTDGFILDNPKDLENLQDWIVKMISPFYKTIGLPFSSIIESNI